MGSSSRRDSWHILAVLLETDILSQYGWSLWTLTRGFPMIHRWARPGDQFCSWLQWWRSVHSEDMSHVQEHLWAGPVWCQLLELRNTVWRPSTPTSTTTFQPRFQWETYRFEQPGAAVSSTCRPSDLDVRRRCLVGEEHIHQQAAIIHTTSDSLTPQNVNQPLNRPAKKVPISPKTWIKV